MQATNAQQTELTNFFDALSGPLRIAVQKEIFLQKIEIKNATVQEAIKLIIADIQKQAQDHRGGGANSPYPRIPQPIQPLPYQGYERIDNLLPAIVERLDTELITPHFDIIVQDDIYTESSLFYFIGKGECKVRVRDQKGREKIVRTLYEGDHFGEISIIYECRRNATVTSMNYNTFAIMASDLF